MSQNVVNPYRYGVAPSTLIWEQLSTGQEESLYGEGVTKSGELFTAGHVTIGSTPTKFIFNLRKTTNEGTPSTTAPLNLIDSSNVVKATFPLEATGSAINVGDLTETFVSHTFVNDSNTETIDDGDRVVFYYSGEKYFRVQVCASCAQSGTKLTAWLSYADPPAWTNHGTKVCTMKVYGTPA